MWSRHLVEHLIEVVLSLPIGSAIIVWVQKYLIKLQQVSQILGLFGLNGRVEESRIEKS